MPTQDHAHFQSIPWCASLINDPTYMITPTDSRQSKKSTEDALFGTTLNSDQTISACLSLFKRPLASDPYIEEVQTLLTLESGVNGYPNICHGGVIATILDEVMGVLLAVNKDREEEVSKATTGMSVERLATVTAGLTITYLKPVATPQTVCVAAVFCKREGRKLWLKGTIKDESGAILARGESVFVQKQREKL